VEETIQQIIAMKKPRGITQEDVGVLIALAAILFGGWVRIFPPAIAGFPINDGGLFSVMIKAIQVNQMGLPMYFQFNGKEIPFAYPPLAFYTGAVIANLTHLDVIEIVRWLPAIILIGTIPAFYSLSKVILDSSFRAGLATLMFAFTPRSMTWTIMGGGLTRSFGLFFLLLALSAIYKLFIRPSRKYLISSILFSTMVILSHPEAAIHTMAFGFFFWVFKGRSKEGIINALTVALGTLILSSIWWIPMLLRYTLTPFLAAAQTGSQSFLSLLFPFLLTLTDEPYLTIVAILGLIGFVECIGRKNFLLPIWYFLPYLVDPRSGATYAMIPLAMLAGVAVSEVILPGLAKIAGNPYSDNSGTVQGRWYASFLIVFGMYLLGGSLYFGTQIAGTALSKANRTAIEWIHANTPTDSRFLVMTGENEVFCDSLQEWFPVLSERISITTIQGDEWLPDNAYAKAVSLQDEVQNCVNAVSPLQCLNDKHLQYDYVYIARLGALKNFCRTLAPVSRGEHLIAELRNDPQYSVVYQTQAVELFSFRH
jgi:hypothetical protein